MNLCVLCGEKTLTTKDTKGHEGILQLFTIARGIIYMTVAAPTITKLTNYVNGQWTESGATASQDVVNPATGEVLARVPLADEAEVGRVVGLPRLLIPNGGGPLRKTASSRCSN